VIALPGTFQCLKLVYISLQDDHHLVAETAVVGFPHPLKGEGVYAYVVLKEVASHLTQIEKEQLIKELRDSVKLRISGFAVPEKIQVFLHFDSAYRNSQDIRLWESVLKSYAQFSSHGSRTRLVHRYFHSKARQCPVN
jgi:acyl-CoA synthetase (AMP-forming)/AMP-acid ligase II